MCLRDEEESSVLTAQHSRGEKSSPSAGSPSFTGTWVFDTVLFMCLSCIKHKKKRFVFRIRHFDHLICLFPQNTSLQADPRNYGLFMIRSCEIEKKSTILYANSNSKFLLWNNLQMITINVLNRSDPSDPSEKNTKMYSKNIYFVLCILQIHYIFMYLVKIPCNCTCIHNWYM